MEIASLPGCSTAAQAFGPPMIIMASKQKIHVFSSKKSGSTQKILCFFLFPFP